MFLAKGKEVLVGWLVLLAAPTTPFPQLSVLLPNADETRMCYWWHHILIFDFLNAGGKIPSKHSLKKCSCVQFALAAKSIHECHLLSLP